MLDFDFGCCFLSNPATPTLGIDSAEAMHKVDARARDIDQISERPHTSLSGLTVDPVEYLWPGARQRVHDLIPNIAPQLKAPMDQDPPAEGSDVPVPPQEIVGGEEIPPQPEAEDPAPSARQRAASAPEDKERAARSRQEKGKQGRAREARAKALQGVADTDHAYQAFHLSIPWQRVVPVRHLVRHTAQCPAGHRRLRPDGRTAKPE